MRQLVAQGFQVNWSGQVWEQYYDFLTDHAATPDRWQSASYWVLWHDELQTLPKLQRVLQTLTVDPRAYYLVGCGQPFFTGVD